MPETQGTNIFEWMWTLLSVPFIAMFRAQRDTDKSLAEHKTHVAESYTSKKELSELKEWLQGRFDRLDEKLDK